MTTDPRVEKLAAWIYKKRWHNALPWGSERGLSDSQEDCLAIAGHLIESGALTGRMHLLIGELDANDG